MAFKEFGKSWEQLAKELEAFEKAAPRIVGNEVKNFALDNFKTQSFDGEAWPPRKPGALRPGRKLLVDTGKLKRSVRVEVAINTGLGFRVIVAAGGTDVPYAAIHNDGGNFNVAKTPKMVAYFWAMFKKTKDPKWKAMALSKKTKFSITIPRRRFLGNSQILDGRLEAVIRKSLDNIFK